MIDIASLSVTFHVLYSRVLRGNFDTTIALKALDVAKATSQGSELARYEYERLCQPVLGRVLCRLGVRAVEAEKAVTAEGLFKR